jgi:predicted Zn-dependent protease
MTWRSSAVTELEERFRDLAQCTFEGLADREVLLLNLEAEDSDFVRVNRARVRQAGHVRQQVLRVELIRDGRSARATLPLAGEPDTDAVQLHAQLARLRDLLPHLPEDPYLFYATEPRDTRHEGGNRLPEAQAAVEHWLDAAQGLDVAGLWSSGRMVRAFANSLGQFNWHSDCSFNADWSVHGGVDHAVKQSHAGFDFQPERVSGHLDEARETLALLARKPKTLTPGRYRVFLAPAALHELMSLLAWGGFGLKSHRTAQTPLIRMVREGLELDRQVSLFEDHAGGLAPRFTPSGFVKPERVELISEGRYRDCLAAARSAREYGVPVNCAVEHPESLEMSGGSLPGHRVLQALGTGIHIGNLWYCNYSDRNHCRITGMTRFACLWVENGRAVAPVNAMRFDESLLHVLGDRLEGITREREHILDSASYERRSEASARLPGILVDGFTFTL